MLATEIIKQLLEAQDLDPMEHFIKEDEKEDGDTEEEQQPQEQDAGVPQLEEEQEPEDQEAGPSRKRKGRLTTMKTVVASIAKRQRMENQSNPVLAKQRQNIGNITRGLGQVVKGPQLEEGEIDDSE